MLKKNNFEFNCFSSEGMSEKAGAQTGPGFVPAEAGATSHQIPAAAQGERQWNRTQSWRLYCGGCFILGLKYIDQIILTVSHWQWV